MHNGAFKNRVYTALKLVPKGKIVTYKELAHAAGSNAYRAVGRLMRTNKDPKGIPCYRVIRSDGKVGNYSAEGGIRKKIAMLRKDGIKVKNGRIDIEQYLFNLD